MPLGPKRVAVGHAHGHQPIADHRESIHRLDVLGHPSAQVGGDPHMLAAAFERAYQALRIFAACDRDIDAEFVGELVELGERSLLGNDEQLVVDGLGELEHLAARGIVRPDVVDAVRPDLLA